LTLLPRLSIDANQSRSPVLYGGPKEWQNYDPGYYAVYFEDPDRIKLELVYAAGDL